MNIEIENLGGIEGSLYQIYLLRKDKNYDEADRLRDILVKEGQYWRPPRYDNVSLNSESFNGHLESKMRLLTEGDKVMLIGCYTEQGEVFYQFGFSKEEVSKLYNSKLHIMQEDEDNSSSSDTFIKIRKRISREFPNMFRKDKLELSIKEMKSVKHEK